MCGSRFFGSVALSVLSNARARLRAVGPVASAARCASHRDPSRARVPLVGWDVLGAMRAGLRGAWVARKERSLVPIVSEPDVRGEDLEVVGGKIVPRLVAASRERADRSRDPTARPLAAGRDSRYISQSSTGPTKVCD
jgi:hypothetical protein